LNIKHFTFFVIFSLLFSCATTTSVTVTRPPAWNTSAISRIAVSPFTAQSSDARQLAQFLTANVSMIIQGTGKFILVDYAEITKLEKARENIADHVDAIFSGSVTRLDSKDRTESSTGILSDEISYSYYRDVNLEFSYMLKRAGDGAIIGQAVKGDSNYAYSSKSRSDLSSAYDIAKAMAEKQLRNLRREIAPWQIVEERVFEEDKMKDPRMKTAKSLVKEKSFRSAHTLYLTVYEDSLNFAAGFNAAICVEILGNPEEAAALMQRLWVDTGNPRAETELTRLQIVVADMKKLNETYSGQTDTVINAAVKQASLYLIERIPTGSRISFVGGSDSGQNTLNFIIEELSTAIVNTGTFSVIDRREINTIIAEHRFQLSGEVSDDTAVSIGRMSGSEIIVSCSITGTGSLRRLRVRTISVEKGEVLYETSLQI
jgi:curli biogenesis system outer membrane secretion channel CsgG